ncbi:hypothetical protein MAR_017201 [Mya arenaria]|uniref:YqaJ viral recombinase domain-containing protein n=1 Tax=Mya arenaria TaxID=6604 RepID=A0ABY7EB61_MYAAR|nr:hypothetical protein MAR_017201 [Mya arenaria]
MRRNTFHKPKKQYSGTPLKAEDLPGNKQTNKFQDPRPPAFRNCANYRDHVRNTVFNYCSNTSKDLAFRYIWGKADIQSAGRKNDYLRRPLLEQWVDNAQHISPEQIVAIDRRTRSQADNHTWREQCLWRVTASRFGEICKLTATKNMNKVCKSVMTSSNLHSKPIIHGKQCEETAPFTPDGVISDTTIREIKCPYSGRDMFIKPGKLFPFLEYDSQGNIVLRQTSNYYYQIQGQLYISKIKYCNFIVYTFKGIMFQKVELDNDYCEGSLIPKLTLFYEKYLRQYIAVHY